MSFSLNPFMPQMYVYSFLSVSLSVSVCLSVCLSLSFIFLYIYIFYYYYYYYYYHYYYYCLCLCVLYMYRPCWEKCKISQGLSLVLYLYFRIFYFCIVELWALVNLKYRKKKEEEVIESCLRWALSRKIMELMKALILTIIVLNLVS